MKALKYALFFFFVVVVTMFILFQTHPALLLSALPQFDIDSAGGAYPRLVGILFLALGLARLYGGLFMHQKGAFVVSMWSWVIEIIYTISELIHGQFTLIENMMALILAPLMFIWSLSYYLKTFPTEAEIINK